MVKFIVAVSIEHAKFSEGASNINLWFRAESMSTPELCGLKVKHFSCTGQLMTGTFVYQVAAVTLVAWRI